MEFLLLLPIPSPVDLLLVFVGCDDVDVEDVAFVLFVVEVRDN